MSESQDAQNGYPDNIKWVDGQNVKPKEIDPSLLVNAYRPAIESYPKKSPTLIARMRKFFRFR